MVKIAGRRITDSGIMRPFARFMKENSLEAKDYWAEFLRLVKIIAARFSHDRCPQMAASLTFTALLSLVPIIVIALTVFSALPAFSDVTEQIKKFMMENMLPGTGDKLIRFYVHQFAESGVRLTVTALLFLAVTAVMTMYIMDRALNSVWHVARPRTLIQRILIYWLVVTLGPLLVGGSLSLTTWMVSISVGYAEKVNGLGLFLLKVTPILLTTPVFIFLFRVMPNRYVPLRHAVIGGIVSAVAFESMNGFLALYITHFSELRLVYGVFASFPVFLLWVYLSWCTVLLGAVVASSLSHWRSVDDQQPDPLAQLYYALCMIRMMSKGLRSGRVQTLPIFSRKLHVGFDYLEQILAKLTRAGLVSKLAGQGWSLIRDPDLIRLGELQLLFMFNPDAIVVQHEDGGIGDWLRRDVQHGKGAADISLRELFMQAGIASEEPPHDDEAYTLNELFPQTESRD
jgi:membrane protein